MTKSLNVTVPFKQDQKTIFWFLQMIRFRFFFRLLNKEIRWLSHQRIIKKETWKFVQLDHN